MGADFPAKAIGWQICLLLLGALTLLGCFPTPALRGAPVSGHVVDARSGAPLADALVVVRWDARHDEMLPDRDVLGFAEVRTDAAGAFRTQALWKAGLAFWPLVTTEARIVGVMREGYRCAAPIPVSSADPVRVDLAPAMDLTDRRASCRPVAARASETPRYLEAWRALHPSRLTPARRERDRQTDRVMAARRVLGFGANCEGPVTDLSLSPDGTRVAMRVRASATERVLIRSAHAGMPRIASVHLDLGEEEREGQLGWKSPVELVIWQPANALERVHSIAMLEMGGPAPRTLWREAAMPAAPAPWSRAAALEREPLERSRALWLGRAFSMRHSVDSGTGLAADRLHITAPDGTSHELALPGEACGPGQRFGRPHERLGDEGRTAFDLRFVKGGCHAVAMDLASGAWHVLDESRELGVCRTARSVPMAQLRTALRGYVDEVEAALAEAGADPLVAWSLHIEPDGRTSVTSRAYDGAARSATLASFPIESPLRRIDTSTLGGSPSPTAPRRVPVAEPL